MQGYHLAYDEAGCADMNDVASTLSAIPGATWIWEGLVDWWSLPLTEWLKRTVEIILQVAGFFEFVRLIDNRVFRRRATLERERELLEFRVKEQNDTIAELRDTQRQSNAELLAARGELPTAAIARAKREFNDLNQEKAIRHLEKWFTDNAASITAIAKELAQYHIVRAVPNPGDHLQRARDMLRLARGASPHDKEVREISNELDVVNAALQEQLLRDGDRQIAWNSIMAGSPGVQGDALLPLVITLRDIARWFFEGGMWRLVPLFADRAAELARQAGRPHRRMWCQQERLAAYYQAAIGQAAEALPRIDYVLSQAREFLPARDPIILDARFVRAQVLSSLGRYGDALAELDAFAPIEAEVKGERHPDTLSTRSLRAKVLSNLGRYGDALAELDAFAPIYAEVQGARHPHTLITRSLRIGIEIAAKRNIDRVVELNELISELGRATGKASERTLFARYRLARLLLQQGHTEVACAEVTRVIEDFDRATAHEHVLLRSAKVLLDMTEGRPAASTLVV